MWPNYRSRWPTKGILLAQYSASVAQIEGKHSLLAQALANLVDNAIKYTPAGGRVTITVAQQTDGIVL